MSSVDAPTLDTATLDTATLDTATLDTATLDTASPATAGADGLDTAPRPTQIDTVRQEFVQLWGAMGSFWGISPTTARVYSWLYSRTEPADTEQIMAGLEMSRGAVSMACRELRDWGLIFPEKAPGHRRVSYRPATDIEKVIRNIVRTRKRREWDPILERLREWIPRLEADPSPEAEVFRRRLGSIEAMVRLADSMLEVFLKGGLVSRVGLKLMCDMARSQPEKDTEEEEMESTEDREPLPVEESP